MRGGGRLLKYQLLFLCMPDLHGGLLHNPHSRVFPVNCNGGLFVILRIPALQVDLGFRGSVTCALHTSKKYPGQSCLKATVAGM